MKTISQKPILIRNGLIAILLCTILVTISYCFIDRIVAIFIYRDNINHLLLFRWLTYIPDFLSLFVIFFYLIFLARFAYHELKYFDYVLITLANSIVIAVYFKELLKFIFGRYWPLTWINNNRSLIMNNQYGFNFFHQGSAFASFPSGHTTIITAAMSVLWFAYPRFRWLYIFAVLLVATGLIATDYHFVSDVIAGGFLGTLTGYYTVKISKLNNWR